MTEERIVASRAPSSDSTTEAAVSSQEDSMARIRTLYLVYKERKPQRLQVRSGPLIYHQTDQSRSTKDPYDLSTERQSRRRVHLRWSPLCALSTDWSQF